MTPEDQARAATKIGEIEHALIQQRAIVRDLEVSATVVSRKRLPAVQARILEERHVVTQMLEEANRLRAQIGLPLVVSMPEPLAIAPPKARRGPGCLLLIAFVVVGLFVVSRLPSSPSSTGTVLPVATAPLSAFTEIDIRDLKKSPEAHRGERLKLAGTVFRISEQSGQTQLQMWVQVPGGSEFDTEAVHVSFVGTLPDVYEKTPITVYGVGAGLLSGENAFGATIDQPAIAAQTITH